MEQLKKVLEIDLGKPEDIDYLYNWAKQAEKKIKELETKFSSQVEPLTYLTKTLIEQMEGLTDKERKDIINEITDNYCFHCGNKNLPCYCMRDD